MPASMRTMFPSNANSSAAAVVQHHLRRTPLLIWIFIISIPILRLLLDLLSEWRSSCIDSKCSEATGSARNENFLVMCTNGV